MADLTVATIASRLEGTVSGLSGWTLAPMPVDLLARSTRPLLHKAASVFLRATSPRAGGVSSGRRQTASLGAYCDTFADVQWAYRIRPDAYASDIRAAYDAESDLVEALMGSSLSDLQLTVVRLDRALLDTRTAILGTVSLRAVHSLALAA